MPRGKSVLATREPMVLLRHRRERPCNRHPA
jgi:hypothetical protein